MNIDREQLAKLSNTPEKQLVISIVGVFQQRDLEKSYLRGVLVDLIPKETHYFIQLEAPTGQFDVEVTRDIWEKHILPNYPTMLTDKEGEDELFNAWLKQSGWLVSERVIAALKECWTVAFEAGRMELKVSKEVHNELDQKNEEK